MSCLRELVKELKERSCLCIRVNAQLEKESGILAYYYVFTNLDDFKKYVCKNFRNFSPSHFYPGRYYRCFSGHWGVSASVFEIIDECEEDTLKTFNHNLYSSVIRIVGVIKCLKCP